MPFQEETGDLFALGLPAVAHGCNTRGSMAGGIAVTVRERFPDLFTEYARRCAAGAFRLGDVFVWDAEVPVVYNLATQERSGGDARIDAVVTTVSAALLDCARRGLPALGVPHLGSGIGGLDREAVTAELRQLGEQSTVKLVLVTLPRR